MTISPRAIWAAALLSAGVALAALATAFSTGTFSFTKTFWMPAASHSASALANACPAPNAETDELFFISCGGIY